MLIVCPSCATSYDVELASLGPQGRQVRCARCRAVWHAELAHADKLLAAAYAIAPGRPAGAAIECAAADPPGDPAVEAPAEEASEVKRYNDARMRRLAGRFRKAKTAAAPAAEDEDGSAAEGAGFPDVPLEAVEV